MARITLEELRHRYGAAPAAAAEWALKRLNLDLSDGGAYALLGPSGCGKTTLLNLISGLLTPTRGRILFGERDVSRLEPRQRNIAHAFQVPGVCDTMPVHDNLAFPLRNRGLAQADIERRVHEIAAMLDLDDRLTQRAAGLTADGKQTISRRPGLVAPGRGGFLFRRATRGDRPAPEMAAAQQALGAAPARGPDDDLRHA